MRLFNMHSFVAGMQIDILEKETYSKVDLNVFYVLDFGSKGLLARDSLEALSCVFLYPLLHTGSTQENKETSRRY